MASDISAKLLSAPWNNWYLVLTRKHLSFKFRYFTWLTDKSFSLNLFVTGTTVSESVSYFYITTMQLQIFTKKMCKFHIALRRTKPINFTNICLWPRCSNYYVIAQLYVNWLTEKNLILFKLFSAMWICNLRPVAFL